MRISEKSIDQPDLVQIELSQSQSPSTQSQRPLRESLRFDDSLDRFDRQSSEFVSKYASEEDYHEDEKITSVRAKHNMSDRHATLWFMTQSPIPVINEKNLHLLMWKGVLLLVVYYIFGSYAWEIIYSYQHEKIATLSFNYAIFLSVFIVDLIINFHVSYTKRGRSVTNLAYTSMHYVKKQFIFDVLAALAVVIFNNRINVFADMICLTLFFLLKIPSTQIMDNFIEDHIQTHRLYINKISRTHASYKIFKIFFLLFVTTNILTMLFYLAGVTAVKENDHSWLITNSGFGQINDLDTQTQLLLAFYWSFGTLMMMNNGDITPKNKYELVVYFIAIILGINLFALSLNLLQEMVQILFLDKENLQSQLKLMVIYMRQRKIPMDLQIKITAYLGEMIYQKQQSNDEMEQALIQSLPQNMQLDLNYQTYQYVFQAIDIMGQFSVSFKEQLSLQFEQQIFCEGDFIYLDGLYDEQGYFLYYISSGEVGVFLNTTQDNQSFYRLMPDRYFGLTSFITDQPRMESMCALTYCRLFMISKIKFLQVLNDFPLDKEKYFSLLYNAIYEDGLTKFCYSCGSIKHDLNICPDVKYVPNQEMLKLLHQKAVIKKTPIQYRQKKFIRRVEKQCNSLNLINKFDAVISSIYIYKSKLRSCQNNELQLGYLEQMYHRELDKQVLSPELIMLNKIYQLLMSKTDVNPQQNIEISKYNEITSNKFDDFEFDRIENYTHFQPHNNINAILRINNRNTIYTDYGGSVTLRIRHQTQPRVQRKKLEKQQTIS